MADYSENNVVSAPEGSGGSSRRGRSAGSSDALRYARDNRFVRAVYSFTTGRTKPLFIALVVVVVVLGIYFPVRDFYIAYRSQAILEEQIAIREAYNAELEDAVDTLTTEEGVQDAAREELGMVMEGETPLTVTGLDEDGNAIVVETESSDASSDDEEADESAEEGSDGEDASSEEEDEDPDATSADEGADMDDVADDSTTEGSESDADDADADTDGTDSSAAASTVESDDDDDAVTSADVDAAEDAVYENSAWYWKLLDAIFFFDGTSGQAVVSTGE